MNIYILLAIIPVVLAVALIVALIRRNITENRGGGLDIAPAIPAIVVLMIAILVIVPMAQSTQDYLFDEDSGELVIQKNIPQLAVQPWDKYADEVTSLVINDGVEIGSGVFDSLTSLKYVEVGEDVSFGSNTFGVTFEDYLGQAISVPAQGVYAGNGDGELYLLDDTIFRYRDNGTGIGGLTDAAASAVNIVIPNTHSGVAITTIAYNAFNAKTGLESMVLLPDSNLRNIIAGAFYGCTGLTKAMLPEGMTSLNTGAFNGCTALESINLPSTLETLEQQCFMNTALKSAILPEGFKTLGPTNFSGCTALETVRIPGSVESIANNNFQSCTAVTEVSFGSGFSAPLSSVTFPWTFYESDGTTEIDKTDPANLAGKTFQGTAAALVEVSAGTLSLTPQQLQMVHLHDAELQDLQSQPISLDPLPFQPSLQTEQEQETA